MNPVSVIVSTYNRPDYLARVLWGYSVQSNPDFEVVIADDGSGAETAAVIEQFRRETKLRLLHVWHEDRGFRKCTILNRAILAASHEYLLFTDGDCIPRADLIETHLRLARPGRYVAGGYLKLPPALSQRLDKDDVLSGRVADLQWLRSQGWQPGRRALRMLRSWQLATLLDWLTPTAADFQGNNASVARSAVLEVNGFDAVMGYGGLDQALGYRLQNAGLQAKQARHRAVCFHLDHDRPYKNSEGIRRNQELKKAIRRDRHVRARDGIAELSGDPSLRVD